MPRSARDQSGQASVELVALVPLLAVLAATVWQAALAGHAVWSASAAARAASRVLAVGGDPAATARRIAGRATRLRTTDAGAVRVTVPIRTITGATLVTYTTTARFEPQR
jgi:Flp pilus assembly protein TadG